tara:strand:+ start:258 stop:503 length:246 start_codon:yes stop_codon:yes gene_type:complete
MSDWKKLSDNVDCQLNWSPRNTADDPTLELFSTICEYFYIGDNLDVAIAKINGFYTYLVVDWEENQFAENTEKSIAFRIKD